MTSEELKNKAWEYARNICLGYDKKITAADAFIAGAHSRDEEIEELMKRIGELEDEVAQLANGEDY